MKNLALKSVFEKFLKLSDIEINGNRKWDLHVKNSKIYERIASGGSLALGESYMDGWWECDSLDKFFEKLFENNLEEKLKSISSSGIWHKFILSKKTTSMIKKKSFEIGKRHYDMSNKLFFSMLDKRLNYSCGYWEKAKTLDEAQEDKLDLICRKMYFKPGMKVLDIGCGWGGFAKYAAQEYGVEVLGITVSNEQQLFASELCKKLNVNIKLMDYRDLNGKFDRIVSVGMFEHVGSENYKKFLKIVSECLTHKGLFLLHTIARNNTSDSVDEWIEKYIFPNSMLPSACHITSASEDLLVIEDWHNFGQYYDNTLMAWYENFLKNWQNLKDEYDEKFFRMWKYYLLSCAGSFRARRNQLWQIVFSKKGIKWGYLSQR